MPKKPTSVAGSTADMMQEGRKFDEAKTYEVTLSGIVEYPPGSRNFIHPKHVVRLSGRAVNAIADKVDTASEVDKKPPRDFLDRPKKSLTMVNQPEQATTPPIGKRLPNALRHMVRG